MRETCRLFFVSAILLVLSGCQNKPLGQTNVQQIWEVGQPIYYPSTGYTKGVWMQQYKQYTFFDQGKYRCRATTLVAQGFSRELGTVQTEGEWLVDVEGSGVPQLKQPDGSFRRIDEIYSSAEYGIDSHPMMSKARRTYLAPQPQSLGRPIREDLLNSPLIRERPQNQVPDPPLPPDPPDPLPIEPFHP